MNRSSRVKMALTRCVKSTALMIALVLGSVDWASLGAWIRESLFPCIRRSFWNYGCRLSQGHRMGMIVAPAVELLRPDPGRLDEIDQMILAVMEIDCKIIWSRDI